MKCNKCKHWGQGHDGMCEPENWATCAQINQGTDTVYGVIEGCVGAHEKTDFFENLTHAEFGCIHFESK
jgi:hypothetical protein